MANKIDKKILLIIAATLFLAGGLIWLAFFWQFDKIKETSDNIQKEQLDSLVKQERSQKVLELGKELNDVEVRNEELKAMLVDKDDAVPFLKTLETMAAATGNSIKISVVDLVKLNAQASKKTAAPAPDEESAKDASKTTQAQKAAQSKSKTPYFSNQLGFSIELTGGYGNFLDFLTKIENLPYFVRVYSFQSDPFVKSKLSEADAAPIEDRSIKSTIIIGVYTNGK